MSFKVAVYNSTSIFDFTPYFIFTGTIVDIQVNGRNNTVNLICEDGWRYLADQEYFREPFGTDSSGVSFEVFKILEWGWRWDYHTDDYIEVDGVGYPWGTNYTPGYSSTNLPRHWWHDGTAKSAVEMITFGSLGRSFVAADGSYNFIDFETTDAVELSLDEDKLLKDVYLPTPWENLRSEVVLKGSNNFWYGNQVVATLQEPIKITAGETVEFTLRYSYEDIRNTISTKIISLDMEAFANSDGTGTDITSNIEEDITPYVYHASVTATNNGGTSGYITKFDITGEPLEVNERIERFESTSYYRAASFILENPWLSVTAVGSTDHIEETITTTWDRERLDLVGLTLVDYLSDVKAYPVIQLRGRWTEQFSIELEDTIALTIGTLGIDDNYWVSKVSHASILSSQDILTTVWLYPTLEPFIVS
jgi:hypothetical protein